MRRGALLIGLMVVLSMTAVGAPGIVGQVVLTLEDALQRTVDHSPEYRQALNRMELAGPQQREAWGAFLPSLDVSLGTSGGFNRAATGTDDFGNPTSKGTVETQHISSSSQGVSFGLPLFEGGRRFSELARARAAAEQSRSFGYRELNRLLAATHRVYLDAQQARLLVSVEAGLLASAQRNYEAHEALFRLAQRSQSDLLGAELRVETSRVSLRRAEAAHEKALLDLRAAIGSVNLGEFDVADTNPETMDLTEIDVEVLVAAALSQAPEVREQEAVVRARQAQHDAARAARWPTIRLNGSLSRSARGLDGEALFLLDPDDLNGGLSLGFSLPIFSQFQTSTRIAEAEVELRNAQQSIRQTRINAERNVRSRYVDLESAHEVLSQRERAREIAGQRLVIVQEEYRLGSKDFEALQRTLEEAAEAERAAVQQRFEVARAEVALWEAAGIVAEYSGLTEEAPDEERP